MGQKTSPVLFFTVKQKLLHFGTLRLFCPKTFWETALKKTRFSGKLCLNKGVGGIIYAVMSTAWSHSWYHLNRRDLSAWRVSAALFIIRSGKRGDPAMADANITKQALAASLRELMKEVPFDKINVAHICERCGMNRKSFYYHFKDKYDLVNWIFDTEFLSLATGSTASAYRERWDLIEKACCYFYENRNFYRSALQIKGQNSFSDHFTEYIQPILKIHLAGLLGSEQVDDFYIDFFADAVLCAMKRWLLKKDHMPPEEFAAKLKRLTQNGAIAIYQEMNQKTTDNGQDRTCG